MSQRHDPCADPLTPEWRQKVERASAGTPPIPAAHRRPSDRGQAARSKDDGQHAEASRAHT